MWPILTSVASKNLLQRLLCCSAQQMAGRPLAGQNLHEHTLGSYKATHWPSTSTVSGCDTMVLAQRPCLLPGGRALPRGKVSGLLWNTARRPASSSHSSVWRFVYGSNTRQPCKMQSGNCKHAASDEGSSTDGNTQPDDNTITPEQVKALLEDWETVSTLLDAQRQEDKVLRGWVSDFDHIFTPVLYATVVTEAMRSVNHFFHVWGDTTPEYFGILQAGALVGWMYVALRSAGMLHMPLPAHRTGNRTPRADKLHSPELYHTCIAGIRSMQAGVSEIEKRLHPLRAGRASSIAFSAVAAVELCRALLEEWSDPDVATVALLVIGQVVGMLVCVHFLLQYLNTRRRV